MRRWGVVGLLDILKEAAMLTGCLDCFQSTGSREALEPELLHKRLLLDDEVIRGEMTTRTIERLLAGRG